MFNGRNQVFHGREQGIVIGRTSHDESFVFEDVVEDPGYMGLGGIVNADVFDSANCQPAGDCFRHFLGIAVHGAVSNDHAGTGIVSAPFFVPLQDPLQVGPPDRPVGGTDHFDVQRSQFFQGPLRMGAVFSHNVGKVPHGFRFVEIQVDLIVEDAPVEGSKAAECIARKEDPVGFLEGDHGLGPVDHRYGLELQPVPAQVQDGTIMNQFGLFRF